MHFDYMREFQAMRDQIRHLEVENAKLTSERDTLRWVVLTWIQSKYIFF